MAASPSAVSLSQTHEPDVMLPFVFSVANTLNTNYLNTVKVCIVYKAPRKIYINKGPYCFVYLYLDTGFGRFS